MRTLQTRTFRKSFDDVPRDWFAGNTVATQLVNSINLLFPEGERFFVRSVRRFEKQIDDPELRAQMRGFYAQEGQHANAHERYFKAMSAQGFEIDRIVRLAERLLRPRLLSKEMCLSITVALEHYTAVMAELMYTDPFFARIEEPMRSLLLWHAAEEIEHKAVAFDVMKQINPSYALRLSGYAIASFMLILVWGWGTLALLKQSKTPWRKLMRDIGEVLSNGILGRKIFFRALAQYIRPSFHPLTRDNFALVRQYLEELEREAA
jgi:uncharacterized protein